jgi:hypothetical protein
VSYRPITDVWILGRCKHKYYGGYPAGFLHRARALIGVSYQQGVLHICGGKVRDYPYRGLSPYDKTLDLDPACNPDYLQDAREPYPEAHGSLSYWPGILIDRPYSEEDADHYVPGRDKLPTANELVRNAIKVLDVGGKVGILDYVWPQPPKTATEVATIMVTCGRNNRARQFTVFERLT